MSKIALAPDAGGTGIFTIASPGTSTNRTLTLPDDTGTIVTNSGNQAGSFTTLNTSGAVVFNDAGADVDFRVEGDTNANLLFVDASADAVGVGKSPGFRLDIKMADGTRTGGLAIRRSSNDNHQLGLWTDGGSMYFDAVTDNPVSAGQTIFRRSLDSGSSFSESLRIDSSGRLLVGNTTSVGSGGIEVKNGAGALTGCYDAWNTATSGDNIFMGFATEAVYATRGSIDYNRGSNLTRYNTTSDATLKNIIGDSDGQKSVQILNSTRIREFAWKEDETQKPQIGVIAQELYETYKGAVSVGGDYEVTVPAVTEQQLVSEAVLDEDGNEIEAAVYKTVEVEAERTETKYRPWAVDKTAFTFHLVAGWQAHEKIINQQADMIAALEARIAALENA